jgi:MEDS: MEthanogen/methylotroph, DcmR Sensory domain
MAEVMKEQTARLHHCNHLVQVYREPVELAESLAAFLGAGFEAGEPAVAVVTAANWPVMVERLEKRGWRVDELQAEGALHVRDADETLAAISDERGPVQRKFNDVVGSLLDLAAGADATRRVRAFGEMVDILVRRGERTLADTLENYWNELGEKKNFSLLCGYKVDVFDLHTQISLLPQVYRTHTHVLPIGDAERMEHAVGRALADVLGEDDAQKVYAQAVRNEKAAPASHLALLWISAHMPRTAEEVLAAARLHFAEAAAA